MMQKALAYKKEIDKEETLVFSFNVSGKCLNNEQYLKKVTDIVSEYQINPAHVQFEITETSAIESIDKLANIIQQFVSKGYCFLIDDFGMAYSTIDYLKKIPCDYLKIDGSFIKDINASEQNAYLAQSIVLMAKAYDKKTIAEFIESQDIFDTVKNIGIDYAQGYFLGRPSPIIKSNENNEVS
jgi:EAL domain-containing protein (putative c-di-GMP-specific phosphodiesterase class I)